MSRVSDVMTQTLVTIPSDASSVEAAEVMRDKNIGDVLVVDNGHLRGIVTDRDLALHALTSGEDIQDVLVGDVMSHKVVTGEPGWSLRRAAKEMAKNQVRRLPIVEHGDLVGILSLGDVARSEERDGVVKKSLKDISKPNIRFDRTRSSSSKPMWGGMVLAAIAAGVVAWVNWTQSGQAFRRQMESSKLYNTAKKTVGGRTETMSEAGLGI
jgi:CBS domain-containing protein